MRYGIQRTRRHGLRGLGACVVGAIDPASGDTIAYCPPTDPMGALTAIGDQLASLGSQIGLPAPTQTVLGLSTGTWMLIGIGVAAVALFSGGRR